MSCAHCFLVSVMASSRDMRLAHSERTHSFVERLFFSAYGQKRGETLATKHAIDLVLEQLEKATKLTESIKAKYQIRA
jgi:hypothetical protein